ncbi:MULTISPECIES: hypothetical protein [unclassified Mameliella]|uniref:hypothetical protein n=1 Tax=unclassified Mameliella TaxID=2630630 RepID=UPI00273E57C9|nr:MULTISPECIES: hypothetical protein [unclassified Mameliella]
MILADTHFQTYIDKVSIRLNRSKNPRFYLTAKCLSPNTGSPPDFMTKKLTGLNTSASPPGLATRSTMSATRWITRGLSPALLGDGTAPNPSEASPTALRSCIAVGLHANAVAATSLCRSWNCSWKAI